MPGIGYGGGGCIAVVELGRGRRLSKVHLDYEAVVTCCELLCHR